MHAIDLPRRFRVRPRPVSEVILPDQEGGGPLAVRLLGQPPSNDEQILDLLAGSDKTHSDFLAERASING